MPLPLPPPLHRHRRRPLRSNESAREKFTRAAACASVRARLCTALRQCWYTCSSISLSRSSFSLVRVARDRRVSSRDVGAQRNHFPRLFLLLPYICISGLGRSSALRSELNATSVHDEAVGSCGRRRRRLCTQPRETARDRSTFKKRSNENERDEASERVAGVSRTCREPSSFGARMQAAADHFFSSRFSALFPARGGGGDGGSERATPTVLIAPIRSPYFSADATIHRIVRMAKATKANNVESYIIYSKSDENVANNVLLRALNKGNGGKRKKN